MDARSDCRLFRPDEVAAMCGLSRKAVYRAIERGELRASKLCSRLRIAPEDIDFWIEANKIEPAASLGAPPARAAARNGLRSLLREPGSGVAA
jgi:excisionase family DNA binding protein